MAGIDDELKQLLQRAKASLVADASEASKKLIEQRLQAVAGILALEWICGDRRFESQGQQMEYWISRIFEELYPDEQPEATRLYQRFGLALPRAQYVTRLLLARRAAHWREAARKELQGGLEAFEPDSRKAAKKDIAQTVRFDISLSRGAYDELVVVYDRMASGIAGQDRPQPPKRAPSSANLVWFYLTAQGVLALLDQLRKGAK